MRTHGSEDEDDPDGPKKLNAPGQLSSTMTDRLVVIVAKKKGEGSCRAHRTRVDQDLMPWDIT